MATVREIKRRIGSVKNIAQVTRALEAVSASRVRKAQAQVMRSRPYSEKAWEVLVNVASSTGGVEHPLLEAREEIRTIDVVLITSDRSLCGAYNNNIIRVAERFAEGQQKAGRQVRWITIGRKGRDFLIRQRAEVVAEFSKIPDDPTIADINPIGRIVIDDFLAGVCDQVFIAYTDFVNTLTQRPWIRNLLPLQPYEPGEMVSADYVKSEPSVTTEGRDYLYEPNATAILDEILPRFTVLGIYQALLESKASEHSARMIAMRNASENALALAEDLTLEYNKARQLAITSEMLDIVGGVAAMEQGSK
jgi:F-type H+-transporting ATPase subunit gamma